MERYIDLLTGLIALITALAAVMKERKEKTKEQLKPSEIQLMKNANITTSGFNSPIIINQNYKSHIMNDAQQLRDNEIIQKATNRELAKKMNYISIAVLLIIVLLVVLIWMCEYSDTDLRINNILYILPGQLLHITLLVSALGINISLCVSIILLFFKIMNILRNIRTGFSYINILWILSIVTQSMLFYCSTSDQIASSIIMILLLFISVGNCLQLIYSYFLKLDISRNLESSIGIISSFIITISLVLLQDSIIALIQ